MKKTSDPLLSYRQKRDFSVTPEPSQDVAQEKPHLIFVVQKHAARSLHYDLRLELDHTLKSWAVPKGPSLDPKQKHLAVKVEDHPLAYADFEGVIPPQQYGAGNVIVWDRGTWDPMEDPRMGLEAGHLKFRLYGEKLQGAWALVRMKGKPAEKQESWLLIKERDDYARAETDFNVVESLPDSVINSEEKLSLPAGAKPGPIPAKLAPQLATLVENIPAKGEWSYEIKFDGYRILARIDNGDVALFTRNGHNWTDKLEKLAVALKEVKIDTGWLDGEIVMLGADGMPDFGALQNAFDSVHTNDIRYFVFDMPFYNGYDLREAGLAERRILLAKILAASNSAQISFSQDFVGSVDDILRSACRMGLEGIIGKRQDSRYVSTRSSSWIKLKCTRRQEFVIVGYTESKRPSRSLGALLLGVYDNAGHLQFAGKAGTGFDNKTANLLMDKLSMLAVDKTPLNEKPRDVQGNWVVPELVAEISFSEWTKEGRLRHAVFHGLRTDKPAALITREPALVTIPHAANDSSKLQSTQQSSPEDIGSKISNPDRIIDGSTGLTKMNLVNYYQIASQWILPELAGRPVSFLRAPSGINGQLFFQKHGENLKIPGLKQLDPALDPGHPALMEIDSLAALIGAVQMNVIEFHTWNATTKKIEKPNRMIFDLDPGEQVEWAMMLEAVEITRTFLEELGLQSFLKTSGGKGLHIVVPLSPRDDWETVKEFSKAVSLHLAKVMPNRFAALSGPRNRVGKVFVDYIRNSRGATTVAAYSVRARPGMGVSVPCSWQELSGLTGGAHWTITNVGKRLEAGANPWEPYPKTKQILRAASKKILLHI